MAVREIFGAKLVPLPSMDGMVPAIRRIALEALRENIRRGAFTMASFLDQASDNVALVGGLETDEPEHRDRRRGHVPGSRLSVFGCATVSLHTDDHLGFYSYLLCLGAVEEREDCRHVLRVLRGRPRASSLDRWDAARSFGPRPLPVETLELRRGSLVLLDNASPHWATAVVEGVEYGSPWSPREDSGGGSLHGVRYLRHRFPALRRLRRQTTALYAGYSTDDLLDEAQLARVFGGIRPREPRLPRRQGRGGRVHAGQDPVVDRDEGSAAGT